METRMSKYAVLRALISASEEAGVETIEWQVEEYNKAKSNSLNKEILREELIANVHYLNLAKSNGAEKYSLIATENGFKLQLNY